MGIFKTFGISEIFEPVVEVGTVAQVGPVAMVGPVLQDIARLQYLATARGPVPGAGSSLRA